MFTYLLTVTNSEGKIFKCSVMAYNPLRAIAGFSKLFCATKDITNIQIEQIYAITQDGYYLDTSM